MLKNAPKIISGLSPLEEKAHKANKLKEERLVHENAIKGQFSKWLEDISYIEDYKMYQILGREILLRVYRYKAEDAGVKSQFLMDMDPDSNRTTASAYDKNVAVAKVISVGPQVTLFNPGDVVTISDSIAGETINPEYTQWVTDSEEAANSRPPGKVGAMPPMYVDKLIQWSKYMFVCNKLAPPTADDIQTYLVPDTYIRSKIKSDDNLED